VRLLSHRVRAVTADLLSPQELLKPILLNGRAWLCHATIFGPWHNAAPEVLFSGTSTIPGQTAPG
jgi:hypothetical protein